MTTMLAEEFAVFDSWFAAFPGPSWPNHLYSITGTSAGCTETSKMFQCTKGPEAKQFPQATIFDSMQESGTYLFLCLLPVRLSCSLSSCYSAGLRTGDVSRTVTWR